MFLYARPGPTQTTLRDSFVLWLLLVFSGPSRDRRFRSLREASRKLRPGPTWAASSSCVLAPFSCLSVARSFQAPDSCLFYSNLSQVVLMLYLRVAICCSHVSARDHPVNITPHRFRLGHSSQEADRPVFSVLHPRSRPGCQIIMVIRHGPRAVRAHANPRGADAGSIAYTMCLPRSHARTLSREAASSF